MAVLVTVDDLITTSETPVITGTCDVDNSTIELSIDAGAAGVDVFNYYALGDWSIPTFNPFEISSTVIKAKDTGGLYAGHTYNLDPDLIRCHNGDYLVIYQTDTSHVSDDAAIVSKRSTDNGVTWGAETLVARNPNADLEPYGYQKAQATIDPLTGRIIVWILHRGAVGTVPMVLGMGVIYSDDHGVTWSTYSNIISDWAGYPSAFPIGSPDSTPDLVPFGAAFRTSLGLVMAMYAIYNAAYLIVSHDNGATWPESSAVLVDTYNASPTLNETMLVQIDLDRLVMIARNDDTDNQYCYWKSSDGGATWSARSAMITSTSLSTPQGASPMMCRKIGTEIHSWFVARVDFADTRPPKISTTRVGVEAFWADPGIAWRVGETYNNHRVNRNGQNSTHYLNCGYASIEPLPDYPYTSLIVYYDQNASGLETDTDLRVETITRLEV